MARLARVVVPGVPHHVTRRGNRRLATFFHEADYAAYRALMAEWCGRYGVAVWAYCLMPNHVHLIVVPESEEGLRRGIGEAHRRYSRRMNFGGRPWAGAGGLVAPTRTHRMPLGQCGVSATSGGQARSHPAQKTARPKAKGRKEISMVSPEFAPGIRLRAEMKKYARKVE